MEAMSLSAGITAKVRGWGGDLRPLADTPARKLPVAPRLYLVLAQHAGAPARPLVKIGQKVRKGELIAVADGSAAAPLHASTSGVIGSIGEISAPHPGGQPALAIAIDADGNDAWADFDVPADPFALSPAEIAGRISAAGVVDLGGAAFLAPLDFGAGRGGRIDTLIINGSECEPYLYCDDRLMRDRAAAVVAGIRLLLIASGADDARVGIEDSQPQAIAAMREAAARHARIEIVPVPARYPTGSDRQLVRELTGREVPADCRAADVGVIVHNVATAYAVQQAVCLGRPLVSRLLTVNGGGAGMPGNYEVPLGTLVSDLIAFTGGSQGKAVRIVMGGPTARTLLPHARIPVVKGTAGILLLSGEEAAAGPVA